MKDLAKLLKKWLLEDNKSAWLSHNSMWGDTEHGFGEHIEVDIEALEREIDAFADQLRGKQ